MAKICGTCRFYELRMNTPYKVYEGGLLFGKYVTRYRDERVCKFMPEEKATEYDNWCGQWKKKE